MIARAFKLDQKHWLYPLSLLLMQMVALSPLAYLIKHEKLKGLTNMRKNSTNCFECHSISVIRQYLSLIPICPAPTKMGSKTESF